MSNFKLGRVRPKVRPLALRLAPYLNDVKPPESVDYTAKAAPAIKQMYLNDQLGDCVIACNGHAVGVWTGNENDQPVVASDKEIKNAYVTICGPNDDGCVVTDVLDYMKTHGLTIGGKPHKIDGYVAVDWTNKTEVQVALLLFGMLEVGLNLPQAWMDSEDVWDVTNTKMLGGHCVAAVGYNAKGVVVSTWGSLRTVTWEAFLSTKWLEECYVLLSPDWYSKGNVDPTGVDVQTLRDDLAKIGAGTIPPIDPTPIPVPPKPSPTPVPPDPKPGLTLEQAIAAVRDGINNHKYFGRHAIVVAVENAAIQGLRSAWNAKA